MKEKETRMKQRKNKYGKNLNLVIRKIASLHYNILLFISICVPEWVKSPWPIIDGLL